MSVDLALSDRSGRAVAAAVEPRKGWLHQDAVVLLRKMILAGELSPGERLREVSMSQRLGMSRTPVREAFRTLAAEGLIDLLPNRSVVVSQLDKTEVADVFSVLGALEALAAQQSAQRMSADQMTQLSREQEALERFYERGERAQYTRTNRRIHELIVEGSNNLSLILAWRLVLPRAERGRSVSTLDHARWTQALEEHRRILDAVLSKDTVRLGSLMQEHFNNSIKTLQRSDSKSVHG